MMSMLVAWLFHLCCVAGYAGYSGRLAMVFILIGWLVIVAMLAGCLCCVR
jgi:hypothetical protein